MAKPPCYQNQLKENPIDKRMYSGIFKWMWDNGLSQGDHIGAVLENANSYWLGGQGKAKWLEAAIPRQLSNRLRKAEYNERLALAKAQVAQQYYGSSKFAKVMQGLLALPRAEKVLGHFGVFMETHAGDLTYRPDMWGVYFRGQIRQFRGAFSKAYTERAIDAMERDPMYSKFLDNGLDVGTDITAGGFLSGKFKGPSLRAWQAGLTVARFEMAKKLVNRWYKSGLTPEAFDDLVMQQSEIANHATGSAKGPISKLGKNVLFGPKLTDARLQTVTADPVKTIGTFLNWKNATYGERSAAWERLIGATQYAVSKTAGLYINQGLLNATGSDEKINMPWHNPLANDYMRFKGAGMEARVGTIDPELKLLGSIIWASWPEGWGGMSKQQLAKEMYANAEKRRTGMSRQEALDQLAISYARSKAQPAIDLGASALTREDWRGKIIMGEGPKSVSGTEYAISQLPIIASGPSKFVYDTLRGEGMSALDALNTVKSLTVLGAGVVGVHVTKEKPQPQFGVGR